MVGVYFNMPVRQQMFFAASSLIALLYNIELESEDASVLRFRTYPKFISFNIILILVAIKYNRIKESSI